MRKLLALAALASIIIPQAALACACGCGVFDVGTGVKMPTDTGGFAWLEYDFLNQHENRHGTKQAPSADNGDKKISTDFYTAGVQYLFTRAWGAQIEIPYWNRSFTTGDDTGISTFKTKGIGDIRLKGIYTGLSEDLSTGLTFGVKLPSGAFHTINYDRDTQIGSGSTDLLLGGYHEGQLVGQFGYFANIQWQHAVQIQEQYRPGDEIDTSIGITYGFDLPDNMGKITPIAQILGSERNRDRGLQAHPGDTGYTRILAAPGLEYDIGSTRLYGEVETPIYQNINGNQLTAPVAFKFLVGYSF